MGNIKIAISLIAIPIAAGIVTIKYIVPALLQVIERLL